MNEEIIQKKLLSISEEEKLNAFMFLQKSGELSHLTLILGQVKSLQDPYVKKQAIFAATNIIKKNLLSRYAELDEKMRDGLAKILKNLDPHIVDEIAADLKSDKEDLRFNAIRVLGLMGKNPRIKEILKTMIPDRNEMVRATAISLLRQMIESADVSLIGKLLNDRDNRVVANCIECIETIKEDRLSQLLNRFKTHPNNRIRANALKALWKMGNTNVYDDLKRMTKSQDNFLMRASACWVIGQCAKDSDFEYLEILADLARDPEKLVRENVIKAFLKVGGDAIDIYLNNLCNKAEIDEMRKQIKV